jgi:2-haloacid dehalogenase
MQRWITFDCYGTLADWLGGMRNALRRAVGDDADRLLDAYHRFELDVEIERPARTYRQVLAETLRRAAVYEGVELTDPDVLADSWGEIPVFDDTQAALGTLRDDGWSIAVLTNCDNDLFELTRPKLGVELSELVTAEQVGSYKPQLRHFREFARRTGATRQNWVHAANSWVHDVAPASRLGLITLWVNRDGSDHDPTLASAVVSSMAELPPVVRRLPVTSSPHNATA